VEPQLLSLGDLGNREQIIHRAHVDRARSSCDEKREQTSRPIGGNHPDSAATSI